MCHASIKSPDCLETGNLTEPTIDNSDSQLNNNSESIRLTINSSSHEENCHKMYVQASLFLCSHEVRTSILVDSGSKLNLIGTAILSKLNSSKIHIKPLDKQHVLEGASGEEIDILGKVGLWTRMGSKSHYVEYLVCNELIAGVILGSDTLKSIKALIDFCICINNFNGQYNICNRKYNNFTGKYSKFNRTYNT